MVLRQGPFPPDRTLANVRGHCCCHNRNAWGMQQGEARDAARHATVRRTAPQQRMIRPKMSGAPLLRNTGVSLRYRRFPVAQLPECAGGTVPHSLAHPTVWVTCCAPETRCGLQAGSPETHVCPQEASSRVDESPGSMCGSGRRW